MEYSSGIFLENCVTLTSAQDFCFNFVYWCYPDYIIWTILLNSGLYNPKVTFTPHASAFKAHAKGVSGSSGFYIPDLHMCSGI